MVHFKFFSAISTTKTIGIFFIIKNSLHVAGAARLKCAISFKECEERCLYRPFHESLEEESTMLDHHMFYV